MDHPSKAANLTVKTKDAHGHHKQFGPIRAPIEMGLAKTSTPNGTNGIGALPTPSFACKFALNPDTCCSQAIFLKQKKRKMRTTSNERSKQPPRVSNFCFARRRSRHSSDSHSDLTVHIGDQTNHAKTDSIRRIPFSIAALFSSSGSRCRCSYAPSGRREPADPCGKLPNEQHSLPGKKSQRVGDRLRQRTCPESHHGAGAIFTPFWRTDSPIVRSRFQQSGVRFRILAVSSRLTDCFPARFPSRIDVSHGALKAHRLVD